MGFACLLGTHPLIYFIKATVKKTMTLTSGFLAPAGYRRQAASGILEGQSTEEADHQP